MVNNSTESKRALLITDHTAHIPHAKSILGKYNIKITTEYESLSSINVIKKSLLDTRNTVFIRKSFSRMVNDWGPPFLIILDYRINLGKESVQDTDHRKLLRTFFISLVIMMKKSELDNAHINFLILTDKPDLAEARNFQKNPVAILDILLSNNDDINGLIESIKRDPGEFNRIFKIDVLPTESLEDSFEKTIRALTQTSETEIIPDDQERKTDRPSPTPSEKPNPGTPPVAHVVFRIDDSTAIIDGKQASTENNPTLLSLRPGQFYIIGRWEYKNQADVAKILGEAITNGIGDRRFHPNDEIVINISDHCTIDATIIASLVMLFTKTLSSFTRKSVTVSFKNVGILENGSGYILIRKYIRHAY